MTILANGLNTDYVTGPDLSQYLVDKSTGQPLAYGSVWFYEDVNRTTPKLVYQLTGSDTSGYSYVALANPIYLSATGTIDDGNGNNIALYYYPYDEFGNLQLYYITVYDANGLLQFTRQAWPFPSVELDEPVVINDAVGLQNMLTNPQFAIVNFISGSTLSIVYTSGTTVVNIAPGWNLNIVAVGGGTLMITQTAVAGNLAYPFNPPYVLTIIPGANINTNGLTLTQQLNINPDWAAPQTSMQSNRGFISGSILLGPNTSILMNYVENAGNAPQAIVPQQTNLTGGYAQINNTIQLSGAANTNAGSAGFDTIQLQLSNSATSIIGNVQVIPLSANLTITNYDQTPVNRQIDQMFNYYQPKINFKPISSYLIGWDFALNPAQFLGAGTSGSKLGPFATGANTSNYFWDQTIIFQSANSGVSVYRDTDGPLLINASATTQAAVIQYLDSQTLESMLDNDVSVNIYGYTNQSAGLPMNISLWATTNGSLPAMGSNASLVTGLGSDGYPTVVSGWTEVTRSLIANQKASFTMPLGSLPADYGFSGWGKNFSATSTSTYFAVVIGTGSLTSGNNLKLYSISLVPGQIPTRPAPQKVDEVLRECQRYYWKSFPQGTNPATAAGATGAITYTCQIASTTAGYTVQVNLPTVLRAAPTVTYYNPVSANAKWYNAGASADSGTASTFPTASTNSLSAKNPQVGGDAAGNAIYVHATLDARLGIV